MGNHVDAATKEAAVRRLNVLATENGGEVPSDAVARTAKTYGVTERTVWRWLKKDKFSDQEKVGLRRDELIAIAQHNGNAKAAWKSLRAKGYSLAYSSFMYRFDNTDTDFIAGVTEGIPAAIQAGSYVKRDEPNKMALVGFDHTELPVWCAVDGGLHKPWISVIQDWATRYILGVVLTEGRGLRGDPGTETIVALIGGVLRGSEAPDGTHVGGLMSVIIADNANAHLAEAVVNGYAALGIFPHFIKPRSPWQNGRTERLIQTIEKEFCAKMPGFDHYLEGRSRQPMPGYDECFTIDELSALLDEWVDEYNCRRPHSSLSGRTPLEAWKSDSTIVERVDPALVRHGFLAEKRVRRVSKNGVRFNGVDYVANELSGMVGREVNVRYLPSDRTFIDVYYNDKFLCTALPHTRLTIEQRANIARIRRNRIGRIDRIIKTGAKRRTEEAMQKAEEAGIRGHSGASGQAKSAQVDAEQEDYLKLFERKVGKPDDKHNPGTR